MNFKNDIINLTNIYEKSISSRSSISILVDKYRTSSDVTLTFDFNQIAFISRSSAQQLVLEKKALEKNRIKFVYLNIAPQVNQMLELAAHKLDRKIPDVYVKEFSSKEELSDFILDF